MSQSKLYAHPFSNNSMRPQLSLEEKNLDYEYVKVDLFKGEHKKPEYLAINPRGQMPALVQGASKRQQAALVQTRGAVASGAREWVCDPDNAD